MKSTLDELAVKYDADKAVSKLNGDKIGHGYTPHYQAFFEPMRKLPIRLLEIGIASGPSMQMWLDYFERGSIYGIDITVNTNEWNTPGKSPHQRYQCQQGNQSDATMWKCAMANWNITSLDILIDDGSHMSGDIITAFECMWPNIVPGGMYCVEDLGVSSWPGTVFHTPNFPTHTEWLRTKIEEMNRGDGDVAELHLFRELAIFVKK